jgi:hypothetical protein
LRFAVFIYLDIKMFFCEKGFICPNSYF